jgi:hypothetical protein
MTWARPILAAVCVGLVILEVARPSDHGVPGVTVILAGAGSAALVGVAKTLGKWLQRPGADDD